MGIGFRAVEGSAVVKRIPVRSMRVGVHSVISRKQDVVATPAVNRTAALAIAAIGGIAVVIISSVIVFCGGRSPTSEAQAPEPHLIANRAPLPKSVSVAVRKTETANAADVGGAVIDDNAAPAFTNSANDNFPPAIDSVGIWSAKAPESNGGTRLTITSPPTKDNGFLSSFPLHDTESR